MTDQNIELLKSVDHIEECINESDLSVCFALGDAYTKMALITEYASENTDVMEFEIFQESSGKKAYKKIKKSIKSIFAFISSFIKSFIKSLSKFMSNMDAKIKKAVAHLRKKNKKKRFKKNIKNAMSNTGDAFKKVATAITAGDVESLINGLDGCAVALNKLNEDIDGKPKPESENQIKSLASANETTEESDEAAPAEEVKTDEPAEKAEVKQEPVQKKKVEPQGELPVANDKVAAAENDAKKEIKEAAKQTEELKKTASKIKKNAKGSPEYNSAVNELKQQVGSLQKTMRKLEEQCKQLNGYYDDDSLLTETNIGNQKSTLGLAGLQIDCNQLNTVFKIICTYTKSAKPIWKLDNSGNPIKDDEGYYELTVTPFMIENNSNIIVNIPEISWVYYTMTKMISIIKSANIKRDTVTAADLNKLSKELMNLSKKLTTITNKENTAAILGKITSEMDEFDKVTTALSTEVEASTQLDATAIDTFTNETRNNVIVVMKDHIQKATTINKMLDLTFEECFKMLRPEENNA